MAPRLRRRTLWSTTLCSILALAASAAAQGAPLDDLTLARRWLERPAVAARLRARDAAVDATRAVPSALPTPRLALRREQAFGDDAGFTTTVAGLEADLDLSGRADLLRAAGVERAAVARAEHEAALVEGICRVRQRAITLDAADAVVGIRSAGQAELQALAAEVRRLVEGRERAAHDADRVALRVELHAQSLRDAEVDAAAARAALSALVGPVAGPVAPDPRAPPDRAAWAARAVEQHPALRALRRSAQAAAADARVADRWWVPGVGVYGAFRRDTAVEGEAAHGYEAGLTVDLPLVDRGAPARAEAVAAQQNRAAALQEAEARLRGELAAISAALDALEAAAPTSRVDPAATVEGARRRYRGGVAPLAELLDTLAAVEARAEVAAAQRARRHHLRLRLACAAGLFPEPALAALVEEVSR